MARWIYCFRNGDERELGSSEKADLRRRYVVTRWKALGRGFLAALFVVPFVLGISIVVDQPAVGWLILIVSLVAMIWLFSSVGSSDKLALVYRRGARIGRVREWHRGETPKSIRHPSGVGARVKPVDAEDGCVEEWASYWEMEERFDRDLERAAGGPVDRFETIGDDGVIITVDGKIARRLIEAPIFDQGAVDPVP